MQAKDARRSAEREGGPRRPANELRLASQLSYPFQFEQASDGKNCSAPTPFQVQKLPPSSTWRSCLRRIELEPSTAQSLHPRCVVQGNRRFVYLLRSVNEPGRPDVGLTSDVAVRLAAHNTGRSPHTARFKPWELVVSLEFADEHGAVCFERYLKSGSGRAFVKRHFA